ncbi:MAG: MmgE/PrpD family protein [Betaproteobacteria bacterium]
MNITSQLSQFCAGLSVAALPPPVVRRTCQLLLDLTGNMIRARHDAESTPPLLAMARAAGFTGGSARVFADAHGYTPVGAALVNGVLAHSLDFDDTHAAGTLHPGAPVIPAALAAGELTGASGADVLAGIVAGYEVTCRIAVALPAGDHYQRGFHPTATCGVFGAAAAAGRVLGLDDRGIAAALGIALSQSAGSLQFLANGAWTKRFQVGWAAMGGFVAAMLAREGFKGAAEPLEGKHGFLAAYAPHPQPARAVQDLGIVFELMATAVKPYPSCRYGHAGIDAVLALRRQYGFVPREVDRITYGLSHAGMLLVGAPADKKANPQNIVDGQFSGPFVLSAALVTGAMNWDSYARLNDPAIRGLLPKVVCEHDPEIEAEFPANMSGKVTIDARGERFTQKVVVPKGEPGNFLTDDELRAKFGSLAEPVLGAARTDTLAQALLGFDRAPKAASVFEIANGPQPVIPARAGISQ